MNNITYLNELINNFGSYLYTYNLNNDDLITERLVFALSDSFTLLGYAKYLEKLDNDFCGSQERKKLYNVKDIRIRYIETTRGPVAFKRRYYQHKESKKYFIFVDEVVLSLKPYQRFSNDLITSILEDVTVDSYQRIAKRYNISKTSVYNLISSYKDIIFDIDEVYVKKDINILYIQADECRPSLQKRKPNAKSNKFMVEQVVVHEGLKNISKNRNKLINKTLYTRANNETLLDFYDRIKSDINERYQYNKMYFYGDGANWITGCCDYLGGTQILDLFHAYQAISRICVTDKQHIDALKFLCQNNYKEEFKKYISDNLDFDYFNDYRKKSYKYIIRNWDKIQKNYILEDSVGCSQEGINYHHFARRLTTLPRGFSEKNARTIAQLICIKNNSKDFSYKIYKHIKQKNDALNQKKTVKTYTNDTYVIKQSYNLIRNINKGNNTKANILS